MATKTRIVCQIHIWEISTWHVVRRTAILDWVKSDVSPKAIYLGIACSQTCINGCVTLAVAAGRPGRIRDENQEEKLQLERASKLQQVYWRLQSHLEVLRVSSNDQLPFSEGAGAAPDWLPPSLPSTTTTTTYHLPPTTHHPPGHQVGPIHEFRPHARLAPHHQRLLLIRTWGEGGKVRKGWGV